MAEDSKNIRTDADKTGLYEKAVHWVTERVKPRLHEVTRQFVEKSIHTYAKDNPRFARMIEFEIRRRGDGAGLTQDVAEPLIWIAVKSASAIAVEAVAESVRNQQVKWIGRLSAFTIAANQGVELLRLIPRYKAGLQGSLEMAKDRWRSIEETGVDPFSSQTRQINTSPAITEALEGKSDSTLARTVPQRPITPDAILQSKEQEGTVSRG